MLNISAIGFSDLDQLALLYEELTGVKTTRHLMKRLFRKINGNKNYILVGVKDEPRHLVGSVMGIICTDLVGKCRPFMVIENVIVSKKFRRQGIGKIMLQYLENCARDKNCHFTMMVSLAKRQEAHAFYDALGYKLGVVQGFKKYL